MPKIYDNIENHLTKGLNETLELSQRTDFCVGYFNLRGWKEVAERIDALPGATVTEGEDQLHRYCRLLVGMQKMPIDILRDHFRNDDDQKMETVAKAYKRYKEIQLTYGNDYKQFKKAKEEVNKRLKELNHQLNQLLYKQTPAIKYEKWLVSHQPFHWFAEFYEIIHDKGGFDVIIGNPPYVEYSKVKETYKVNNYLTEKCGNLYTYVAERSFTISSKDRYIGLIIPISSFSTDRMSSIQKECSRRCSELYLTSYGIRPSKLFDGAEQRLSIFIGKIGKSESPVFYSSKYYRWYNEERESLFQLISYQQIEVSIQRLEFPKISTAIETSVFKKIKGEPLGNYYFEDSKDLVYWHRIPAYFIKGVNFVPYFKSNRDGEKKSEDYKVFGVSDNKYSDLILAILNSTLFYWHWFSISDGYHCGKKEILSFPITLKEFDKDQIKSLSSLSSQLMKSYKDNSQRRKRNQKTTIVEYDEFVPSLSKSIIDKIDLIIGAHYSLSEKELDFIINYDIKYRMGKELEDED